jgi:hypothetical protein
MADEPLTPVRAWIQSKLLKDFPNPGSVAWSDDRDAKSRFELFTGLTQDDLLRKWFQFVNGKPDFNTVGYAPSFTVCTSYLPRLASEVGQAGGLPKKSLRPVEFAANHGWTPYVAGAEDGPKVGDFIILGVHHTVYWNKIGYDTFSHVAVIAQIDGPLWSVVAGGLGGRKSSPPHDGVGRSELGIKPDGIIGYINADVYFENWSALESAAAES